MIADVALWLALGAFRPQAGENGLQRAVALAAAGDFEAALRAARADPDVLHRAQATVHVLHRAGDVEGALDAASEGLATEPNDPWLNERAAYIALTLRRPELTLARVDALDRAVAHAPAAERARWDALGRDYRAQAEGLRARLARQTRALLAARLTCGVLLGALALAWISALRGAAGKGKSP